MSPKRQKLSQLISRQLLTIVLELRNLTAERLSIFPILTCSQTAVIVIIFGHPWPMAHQHSHWYSLKATILLLRHRQWLNQVAFDLPELLQQLALLRRVHSLFLPKTNRLHDIVAAQVMVLRQNLKILEMIGRRPMD